jgi:hypothetical protein
MSLYVALAVFCQFEAKPEFLKILKCNSAESVSAGFQFNYFDIFMGKTLNFRYLDQFSGLLKCIQKNLFYQQTTIAWDGIHRGKVRDQ